MRRTYATLAKSQSAEVLLLKSVEKTGEGGAGQPLNDLELLVISDPQAIYEYTKAKKPANSEEDITRFFIDDKLRSLSLLSERVCV